MSYCINCGTPLGQECNFCPECGISLTSEFQENDTYEKSGFIADKYRICKHCGEMMPEDAFYCLACGNTFDYPEDDFENVKDRVINNVNPSKRPVDTSIGVWKNKWISLILCVFFGVFGLHRFYEGKRITGFIYLFSFGVLGIGWFFDIILIATKPNPYRVK